MHWPDGRYTDGIDRHIADLKALFVWAPDTRILEHPIRIAMNEFTAVTGRKRWTTRWKAALNAFDITFEGRLTTARN